MKSTRMEAAQNGDLEYYTGKPCKNGHITIRNTLTGACKECNAEYVKRHKNKYRDLINAAREEAAREG